MTATEFNEHLAHLKLEPAEAAQLLSVSPRTLRRWIDDNEIPGPAEAALRAWRRLSDRNLPWKPDAVSVFENDQDQIARHRRHTKEMVALIARVEARGGAKDRWTVDLSKNSATFGPFEVGFYKLQSGGFSLSNYRRKDVPPDQARDWLHLEDAAYCINMAFSNAHASMTALMAVAEYTRKHSSIFVTDGPRMLTPAQRARRQQEIEALADKIDELAVAAAEGKAKYEQFEGFLSKLHDAGFFPEMPMISAVAKAMV